MKVVDNIKLYGQKAFTCCLVWLLAGAIMSYLKKMGFNASEDVSYVVIIALWTWIFLDTKTKNKECKE